MAKPLGYERYSLTGIESDVFFERTEKEIYAYWAKPLGIWGSSGAVGVSGKRLIDIEAHVTTKKKKQTVEYSGVWIQNTGYFKQDSWFQTGVSLDDLIAMHSAYEMDFIPLDIERYKLNGKQQFALIWQRNVHKSRWYYKFEVSHQNIRNEEAKGFRLVDFDHYKLYMPEKGFIAEKFDGIMVENTGGNYLNYEWVILLPVNHSYEWYDYAEVKINYSWGFMFPSGSTAVDVEHVSWGSGGVWPWDGHGYALVIHNVGACDFSLSNTTSDKQNIIWEVMQPLFGRIIDIEGGDQSEPYIYGESWTSTGSTRWHALHGCNHAVDGK